MMRIKTVLCIGILYFGTSAAGVKDSLVGVWSGTVGKAKINACFQEYGNGNYYYLKYRQPIRLQPADDADIWYEPDSCQWVIENVAAGRATGTWKNPKKNVTLPVILRYRGSGEGGDYEKPCACNLYNNPIEKLPPVSIDTVHEKGIPCYRRLNMEADGISMTWFELCGNGAAEQKLNEEMRTEFPVDSGDGAIFYDCRRGTLDAFASDECEYNRSISPYLWLGRYLEISESVNGFCGGAHPFFDGEYRMYDLSTGEKIDLDSWVTKNETLDSLILQQFEPDEDDDGHECADMVRENRIYKLRLDSAGIVFYTAFGHCCVACDQEFLLTFKVLQPFLTEEGKKGVKLLLKKDDHR